jgi:outer membrane protein
MNRRLILSILSTVLLLPLLGMAQAPVAGPAPTPAVIGAAKVAWLNLEQAIFSTEEGKREFGEVQKFVDKKNSELEALKKELETLKNQLSIQGAKLTDEARADLEEQIEARDTGLQRFQQDTQKEIDARRVKTTNLIGRRMLPVIEKLAREKALSAVVYINPSRDAFVDPSIIITDEVIKAYNQANPGGAAKIPAAAPAKKP